MSVQTSERRDVCGVRTGPKVPRAQIALTSFNVTCGSAPLHNFLNLERREICLSMRRKQSPAHARTNSIGSFHATAVYPHQHGQHRATVANSDGITVHSGTPQAAVNLFQVCCHKGLFISINMFIFLPSAERKTQSF